MVKYFDVVWASLVLSAVLIARLLLFRKQIKNSFGKIFEVVLWVVLINNILNLYFKNDFVLKLYPFLMSFGVFCLFSYSLVAGEPIIEKFALQFENHLTEAKKRYIRKLTAVWTGWLFVNSALAFYTAMFASYEVWLLYNNIVFYIVSGSLFAADVMCRKLILKRKELKEKESHV